ncbi:hypothetical protein DL93DRAFT_1305179 [Clavulina sp. PMI_390]|nr:hypothetical protein DL93DRAFT_1305179 [Clavulina sp. PMI_390]
MLERTFAVLKPAFISHRLNIETVLIEAGFDVIKERQLEFHPEDENLGQLFAEDAESLKGGPVHIYVLDKANAIADLLALAGDPNPIIARELSPESIRAQFSTGDSLNDNVLYVAPDAEWADVLINSIFVSSPPFPPADAPLALDGEDNLLLYDDEGILADAGNRSREMSYDSAASLPRGSGENAQFRARKVPTTTAVPSIAPRMSRAAALRAGLLDPKASPTSSGPRAPLSKEDMARTFANVPGHKRASTIAVASTAPPTIAPRATRASLLRKGETPVAVRPRASLGSSLTSETPGYKRNLKLNVASTAPPAIQPRATKASALRTGQPAAPADKSKRHSIAWGGSSSPMLKAASSPKPERPKTEGTFVGVPGHKRAESIAVASTKTPSTPPRLNRSAELRARKLSAENASSPNRASPPATLRKRPSSVGNVLSLMGAGAEANATAASGARPRTISAGTSSQSLSSTTAVGSTTTRSRPSLPGRGRSGAPGGDAAPPSSFRKPREESNSPPRSESRGQSRPSSVASVRRAPSIEPKTNRAALLRARAGTPVKESKMVF